MDHDTWIGEYTQGCRHLWPIAVFSPPRRRRAMLALLAFDAELRRIPHKVKEPMLGAMRYQWWRDMLGGASGDMPVGSPPLVRALAGILDDPTLPGGLARASAAALIDAAQDKLTPVSPADVDLLKNRATAVARAQGALMRCILMGGGSDNLDVNEDALFHALRALEALAGLSERALGEKAFGEPLKAALLACAEEAIVTAAALSAGVDKKLRPALVAITLGRLVLFDVRKHGVGAGALRRSRPLCARLTPWRLTRLGWAVWRGRF
ncbi:squalene/phytoene synthase family protein [Varunaivibrio sulfuroxidans]|uniref:Squalene/phytoene synthase n=1 Tax=Varunaivibrio sulfuroxidans TaxID=1773489 RepID=A0A4R3J8P9_9PROT|nr:squalene/phytoene synthase family protein [Varunaivibrio sulfuroxidans]TCS61306.1 squalene/phytoene synthase [Varunaivibrio sulfuroxidans]WES31079.1 squalene/phytoene synthase family protein [Varunaivibrio sulfuroxidans]